ncbi:MAG TPA: hypothetical protein VFA79_03170 [Myxococcales bacterium]|nr:hypothetical protein [Myxococcales bacterium]
MKAAIAVVLAAFIAGCGGSGLSLSVRAGSASTAAVARSALTAGNGIVLTRVRVVISAVELQRADTAEMDEMASGPYLLDLQGASLDSGSVSKLLDASVAAGTYSEIQFQVHKPDNTEHGANADLADMIAANASIIADGTIDGVPFSFTSAVTAEQKFEGTLVLAEGSNLTLNVDAASWFTSGGSRLDPRSESNRSQIENNIQQSFQAFRDDNHDGHVD